jgi:adenine deaminase
VKVTGHLVDIHNKDIYPATISIGEGRIQQIKKESKVPDVFIMPGLIDAHIHIESSMTTPGSFAAAAVSRGTTGVVSDPHEIANVLGSEGVRFMIEDSRKVPLRFWFGAPSCVPATSFESSGAEINSIGIRELLNMPEIKYLSEMMNFPGILYDDPEVWKKIAIAKNIGKPIDGHAPGLSGAKLKKYISAGISTDHECTEIGEAKEKIALGMKILIREGSAAGNLEKLKELIKSNPDVVMLCSDDLHPEMLKNRHINKLVADLITDGFDVFDVIRSATINPIKHYNLEAGLILPDDNADFIVVNNLQRMDVIETWIGGEKVFNRGKVLFEYSGTSHINKFYCSELKQSDIQIIRKGVKIRVIEALDGQLLTKEFIRNTDSGRYVEPDLGSDILKIVVKDRYGDFRPSVGFIKGFGLKRGAFASSVAHDSHNIICVGTNDEDIVSCINEIVRMKGGLAVASERQINSLQLPIAGIMSDKPVIEVSEKYEKLSEIVKSMGCKLVAPYMTLSFMALLVIPELKIGDRGLFNVNSFKLVSLFVE